MFFLIEFLINLSKVTEKDGKSLFFKKEHISLYIKLLEKYKKNSKIFSKIVDYISELIFNSIINQNRIISIPNEDRSWDLFMIIYNADICNLNSYFIFLSSFNKILYSEQIKKFQILLAQKAKEELIRIFYNNDIRIKDDKEKTINLYIVYQRLALSSSNEIIELFFEKEMGGYYILDLLIKYSITYPELKSQVLSIIGDIASTEEINICRKLLDTDCFIFIKEIIENNKTSDYNKKNVLWVLSNLCNETIFYEEMDNKNLFKDIIVTMENINYIEAINEGLICLGTIIAIGNEMIIFKLIDLGFFQCIFKIMEDYSDRNILKTCFDTILITIHKGNFYYNENNGNEHNNNNLFLQKFNEYGGEERIHKLYRRVRNKDLIQSIDTFIENYYHKN